MRAFSLLLLFAFLGNFSAQGKVAGMSLADLANKSDVIVVARVDRVSKPLIGKKWAVATVTEVWKGNPDSKITFLASPTWTCDILEAVKGETVVLFLTKDKKPQSYVLGLSGRGRMPVRDVDGKRYATFWSEVYLPKGTPTIAGPEPKLDFIESIEIERLRNLVSSVVEKTATNVK
jgi:hypothetical protein